MSYPKTSKTKQKISHNNQIKQNGLFGVSGHIRNCTPVTVGLHVLRKQKLPDLGSFCCTAMVTDLYNYTPSLCWEGLPKGPKFFSYSAVSLSMRDLSWRSRTSMFLFIPVE